MDLPLDSTLGPYRIIRPLGRGGMGGVYEVEHVELGVHRALNLEKAVAVTRTPRAEPISLAETRRRGEFESHAGCFMKISLHPIGEGHPF